MKRSVALVGLLMSMVMTWHPRRLRKTHGSRPQRRKARSSGTRPGPADRGEGREALRGRLSRYQGRGAPHRFPAHPPARDAGAAGEPQARRTSSTPRTRATSCCSRTRSCSRSTRRPASTFPGGLQGQGRLLLRPARHRERDRLQHEARAGGRGAQDVEGPARPEVEGQARHRPSRLQRRHRDPRAGARAPARLGLLQAARPEQAHARPVGGRPGGRGRLGERQVAVNGGDYTTTR